MNKPKLNWQDSCPFKSQSMTTGFLKLDLPVPSHQSDGKDDSAVNVRAPIRRAIPGCGMPPQPEPKEFHMNPIRSCAVLLMLLVAQSSHAQDNGWPARAARAPLDTPYPGTIELRVDATDRAHRVFRVQETIPVKPGPLTLYYPEWLPGNHAARGPISALTGLIIRAGEQRIEWTRDPLDVYAFHLSVPEGVQRIALEFQFASPLSKAQGRIVATPDIIGLQWNAVVLYPAGYFASRIPIDASLVLPDGWDFGSALEVEQRSAESVDFKTVSLDTLVDSPLFAGAHFRREDLAPGAKTPVYLNIVADTQESLEITDEQLAAHRNLVAEAKALFGAQHYDHYDFLLALSDHFSGIGLEHHRSSENGRSPGYFTEWDKPEQANGHELLAHEMTHSWNGKYRRGADLATPHFNTPMQDSLLWVYEGMTQYYGKVLAARSGLWNAKLARAYFANVAATYEFQRPGRVWRPLIDTTNQPIITPRLPLSYTSWQRSEDYYNEGLLLWLDADTKIRELTRGRKSLDDFARTFFGMDDGSYTVNTYTRADVVDTLNGVVEFDWSGFLADRLEGHGPQAPLDGIKRSGWTLTFGDEPNEYGKGSEAQYKSSDFGYSLGMSVGKDGDIKDVVWDSLAFDAGLSKAMTIVAVNGREYSGDVLKAAVKRSVDEPQPIELLIKDFDRYRSVSLDYHGGLRYPKLERGEGKDLLSSIFESKR